MYVLTQKQKFAAIRYAVIRMHEQKQIHSDTELLSGVVLLIK